VHNQLSAFPARLLSAYAPSKPKRTPGEKQQNDWDDAPTKALFAYLGPVPAAAQRSQTSLDPGQSANLLAVETVLSVLQVIISVIVVFLVLMHSGKDSGLSGAFGVGSGTGPLGGGSMVERNLNRWTIFFAVLFIINAIILLKRPWA
jgi:preprotein translocase subunit SecG